MRHTYLIVLGLLACMSVHANILPDISWEEAKQVQHDSTVNQIWLTADRPGAGTGTEVLPYEVMMWETGFEVQHALHKHTLTIPTTLFRFGLPGPAELRLEYTGSLDVIDKQPMKPLYDPSPLTVGTKINIFENHGHNKDLRWALMHTLVILQHSGQLITRTVNAVLLAGSHQQHCRRHRGTNNNTFHRKNYIYTSITTEHKKKYTSPVFLGTRSGCCPLVVRLMSACCPL